jgi:hypothetical protein
MILNKIEKQEEDPQMQHCDAIKIKYSVILLCLNSSHTSNYFYLL